MATSKAVSVPQVRNIADLKSTPRSTVLIHFTEEQWKSAIKGVKEGQRLKKSTPFLEFTPLPDGGGIIHADCGGSPGPDERCAVRTVVDLPRPIPEPPGPGPKPGPEIRSRATMLPEQVPVRFECRCRKVRPPADLEIPRAKPPCELQIERDGRIRFGCVKNSCEGKCALVFLYDGRRFKIACECSG